MSNSHPGMLMPALVGGVTAGVLTAVPFFGCLCCLWIVGGAMLATYLLARNSPLPLRPGDGALVGILSGIVAAFVDAVVSLPFQSWNKEVVRRFMDQFSEFSKEMPSGWETWLERTSAGFSPAWFLLGLVFAVIVYGAFGALGGIIGVSLFGKKKTPPASGVNHGLPQDSGDRQP